MGREIKFRVWDGFTMEYNPPISMISSASMNEIFIDNDIMQFIGLLDKNGKEIFEGDIIRVARGDWGVIKFKAPFFGVTISEIEICNYTKEFIEESEIIGNIYENPELLDK